MVYGSIGCLDWRFTRYLSGKFFNFVGIAKRKLRLLWIGVWSKKFEVMSNKAAMFLKFVKISLHFYRILK